MYTPLAARLRPHRIEDMVGQQHLIGKGKPLYKIIESGSVPNMIFYGYSGIGKTTLARIIAEKTDKTLYKLNATTASTSDSNRYFSNLSRTEVLHLSHRRLKIRIFTSIRQF